MTKFSNSIIIGGPIMSGKTTIIKKLSQNYYCETSKNDELQNVLLTQSFEGDEVAAPIYAFDKMLVRFDKYKEFCNNKEVTFFSSSILEDHFFAYLFFSHKKNI
jgi:deoxyadenosine/deoxycytidine kinase